MKLAELHKRKLGVATAGVVFGLIGFMWNLSITGGPMAEIKQKCIEKHDDLAPYEPRLGGHPIGCMFNQFFFHLIQDDAWFVSTGSLVSLTGIISLIFVIESSETTNWFVKIPFITVFISQYCGLGFMVPLLWVPFYVYGRVQIPTLVHPGRIAVGVLYGVWWFFLIFMMAYGAKPDGYRWACYTAMIGGPIACAPILLIHLVPKKGTRTTAPALSDVYQVASVVLFALWVPTLYSLVTKLPNLYPVTLIDFLYTNANFAGQMLIVDCVWVFLSMLLYVINESGGFQEALLALVLMPILGPGAAMAFTLSDLFEDDIQNNKKSKRKIL